MALSQRSEEFEPDEGEGISAPGTYEATHQQTDDLDRNVLKLARNDAQVRRFMSVPGVGPITALLQGDDQRSDDAHPQATRDRAGGARCSPRSSRTAGPPISAMIRQSMQNARNPHVDRALLV